jgi:iron complex outermembrane recepter protein
MFVNRLVMVCFICAAASSAPADTPTLKCEIAGRVLGPNGAGLAGALISVRNLETGRQSSTVAGVRGLYRVTDLCVGDYEVRTALEGFEPAVADHVHVPDGEIRSLDIVLQIAVIREIVTVVGTAARDSLEAVKTRESSARDIGEALAETGGISKLRKGGIANDIVLRGFQSKDLNVLIDGQRIYGACPNHMDPAAFHVDFAEVDHVEIGKGPFDLRNSGSLGGVVNIVTRKPEKGLHASATLATGSFGYVNPSATVSYADERFSTLGGYAYRTSDPYSDGSGARFTNYANYRPGSLDSDAFRAGTAWAGVSVSPATNHLLQFSYTRQETSDVLYPYLQMDAMFDNADRANFGYQIARPGAGMDSIRIQGYFTGVRHWMTDAYRTSSSGVARDYSMGTFAATRTLGGKVEMGRQNVTFGFEGFNRYWHAATQMAGMGYTSQSSIPDVAAVTIGAYADYRRRLTDRIKLEFGGRIDRTRTEADSLKANTNLYFAYNSTRSTSAADAYPSGSARLSYTGPAGLEFSGGMGTTVRVPDATERYFGLRRAGSDWVGNPELRPSRNSGFDGSVSLLKPRILVNSTVYWNQVSNFVNVRRAAKVNAVAGIMNSIARSYENVDAILYGTELQIVYPVTHRVFFSHALSYTRGTQDPRPGRNIHSRNLAEMPPLNARSSLRFENRRFFAEIEEVLAGAQRNVDTDLREEQTAGYALSNLRAGTTIGGFRLNVGVNNVFDRLFREHLSYQRDPFRSGTRVFEPGRNVFIGLSYRF